MTAVSVYPVCKRKNTSGWTGGKMQHLRLVSSFPGSCWRLRRGRRVLHQREHHAVGAIAAGQGGKAPCHRDQAHALWQPVLHMRNGE